MCDLVGGVWLALGLIISEDEALKLGQAGFSGDTRDENLQLPAVRDRLKQSRRAKVAVLFLVAGFVVQIVAMLEQRETACAKTIADEALAVAQSTGDPWRIGGALNVLGRLAHESNDPASAARYFSEELRLAHELRSPEDVAQALDWMAAVEVEGNPDRAARLCSAAAHFWRQARARSYLAVGELHETTVVAIRDVLTADAFDAAVSEGEAMTLDEAVDYALGDVVESTSEVVSN
jgi:hypothetical protein